MKQSLLQISPAQYIRVIIKRSWVQSPLEANILAEIILLFPSMLVRFCRNLAEIEELKKKSNKQQREDGTLIKY